MPIPVQTAVATDQTRTDQTPAIFLDELDEGAARWFLGERTWVRAAGAQTGGALGLVEQVVTPGFASPFHVHRGEDEAFYVLEGQVRFVGADGSRVLGPGGVAFLPRGVPHGFRVEGEAPARILLIATPAGFASFVDGLCEPAPPAGPPDMAALMAAAARHEIEILGPLPE